MLAIGKCLAAVCAILWVGQSVAQARYGAWSVEATDKDTIIASTTNDSGGMFAKICWVSTQKCIWVMTASQTCKSGDEYVGLLNSKSGAQEVHLTCTGNVKDGQLLSFNDYEKMDAISANDSLLGIAMPLQDGAFKVFRFSLNGSHEATKAAEQAAVDMGKNNTSEQTL